MNIKLNTLLPLVRDILQFCSKNLGKNSAGPLIEAQTSISVNLVLGTLKATLNSFGGGPFLSQTGCHPLKNENL